MKSHDELNKVFGIAPVEEVKKEEKPSKNPDIEDDYEFARATLRNMVERGEEALDDMMAVAKGSELPRAFEVTSTLINTISGAAKDLISLQKTMKEINKPAVGETPGGPPNGPQNVTNNNIVFQGTTSELLQHIKDARSKTIDI